MLTEHSFKLVMFNYGKIRRSVAPAESPIVSVQAIDFQSRVSTARPAKFLEVWVKKAIKIEGIRYERENSKSNLKEW